MQVEFERILEEIDERKIRRPVFLESAELACWTMVGLAERRERIVKDAVGLTAYLEKQWLTLNEPELVVH